MTRCSPVASASSWPNRHERESTSNICGDPSMSDLTPELRAEIAEHLRASSGIRLGGREAKGSAARLTFLRPGSLEWSCPTISTLCRRWAARAGLPDRSPGALDTRTQVRGNNGRDPGVERRAPEWTGAAAQRRPVAGLLEPRFRQLFRRRWPVIRTTASCVGSPSGTCWPCRRASLPRVAGDSRWHADGTRHVGLGEKALDLRKRWCPRQDSNLRPSAPEADALSPELRGRM